MTRDQRGKRARTHCLLRMTDTTKYHGDLRALGPISIDVPAGQLVALLGPNGSGKSTLLATIAGQLEPTDGSVSIAGCPAGEQAARAAVSYLRDRPILYEDLSLNEHLEYLSRLHGSTPAANEAGSLIDRLGLTDRADDVPSTYSRGLRQKAAIVVALCRPFALLLLDEPFSGLDPRGRVELMSILTETRADGGTVVAATHDLGALDGFERAVMLNDGEATYDGDPRRMPRP